MHVDSSDEETAALLWELDGIIGSDRYFLSPRITTLKGDQKQDQIGTSP